MSENAENVFQTALCKKTEINTPPTAVKAYLDPRITDILCFFLCLGNPYTYRKSIQCVSIALKLTQTVEDRILPQSAL